MVKYGKLFRELQINEFKGNYINYKMLKKKIKALQKRLPRTTEKFVGSRRSNVSDFKIRPTNSCSEIEDEECQNDYADQYSVELKEFKLLLDEEFQICYKFFKRIKKSLHNKLNRHLYTQTNYMQYDLEEIFTELNNLRNTTYLAKCLNVYIHDNMMAIKKILKKFDKKFSNYFGNIGPQFILKNLCKPNSEMEYLLQFKIIDEVSCICESNLSLLTECFRDYCINRKVDNNQKEEYEQKRRQIIGYLKDIDELIYFKIQYKEWFYFLKNDNAIISNSKLFTNLMFNPILFSAYYKDDLMNKFISRKDAIKEIEEIQVPLSLANKINISLIFIQTFFYNTLISGIYPLLFEFMAEPKTTSGSTGKDLEFIPYSLFIIASTYLFSYFSIMFDHYFGTTRIKGVYTFSYILFFIGSISYTLSFRKPENYGHMSDKLIKNTIVGYLVASRVLIGLGANPTMGKKYILNNTSQYFLPLISKIYFFISILGHSVGPLVGFFLYGIEDKKLTDILYYSKYNCIGWYGVIMSIILLVLHLLLFTSPSSPKFSQLNENYKLRSRSPISRSGTFLEKDLEDTQDKEFYRLRKEKEKMKMKMEAEDEGELLGDNKMTYMEKPENFVRIEELDNFTEEDLKSEGKNTQDINIEIMFRKSNTLLINSDNSDINTSKKNKNDSDININPSLLLSDKSLEKIKDETQEEGSFVNINMIPRTIEDLIRKEVKSFGYLNKNLLIILIILFFDNLVKENFVGYCSYFFYYSLITNGKFENYINPKYLSCLISLSYFFEISSLPFILPFYKINRLMKKILIILMISSLLLMIPLSISYIPNNSLIAYFIIISLVFGISSIIEVLSSCYLAYLTPPTWKFSSFNAGALPLYIMTFGKIIGCLICLTAFSNRLLFNHHFVLLFSFIGYGISGIFILKSKNFRIKAIARIMRKTELEQNFL